MSISEENKDGLIINDIVGKKEVYYLVTGEYLKGIRGNSILTDLFLFLASVLGGGFLTVIIAINTTNLSQQEVDLLFVYKAFMGYGSLIFLILAGTFMFLTYQKINGIQKTKLPKKSTS